MVVGVVAVDVAAVAQAAAAVVADAVVVVLVVQLAAAAVAAAAVAPLVVAVEAAPTVLAAPPVQCRSFRRVRRLASGCRRRRPASWAALVCTA